MIVVLLMLVKSTFIKTVACEVDVWVKKEDCSKSCGEGLQTWTRDILVQPVGAENYCPVTIKVEPCNEHDCLGWT